MTDQALARKTLQDLIKREDLKNKTCIDCGNPNPQWASLSFAVFLCLQCAGTHRGFGVHISFVRSVSMDTWQDEQIRRMKLGGNAPFRAFMQSYPAEGGYNDALSPYETYHCWAATQYREKLDAELAGKPWEPSSPPVNHNAPGAGTNSPGRPSSAQGLRKSRASARSNTGNSFRDSRPTSPSSLSYSPNPSGASSPPLDQKSANENYFSRLGQANASRPDDLPPSQGGRYQGFGSTPSPSSGSQHPSFGMSSAAAPTLSDLQENPMAALSKGWSLFSTAVAGATKAVSENVIQPGIQRVQDPTFQASVKGYVAKAGEVGSSANDWGRRQLGVDVASTVGGVKDRMGLGRPDRSGYGAVGQDQYGEHSGLYHDDDEFFGEFSSSDHGRSSGPNLYDSHGPSRPSDTASASANTSANKKHDDGWEDW
ncbi:ArfGap-domain-containing protein [Heliocybe sulcata]|uniref:ArfGap-domain-containing protein n=1 Tax=Heliocybe sulcata TaxID=5364 RepID=A0A5C3ND28_9AGAM|nr:ArfGap-domain-containing protein [Heliocybe sulcata]